MNADEIKSGLLSLDKGHPFYQALIGLLDSDIADEQEATVAPGLSDGTRQFYAGRLGHAVDIKRAIIGVIEEAEEARAAQWRREEMKREREQQPKAKE